MKTELAMTLVVNPTAGRGRAKRLLPQVCSALLTSPRGIGLRVETATDVDHAGVLCEQAVASTDVLLVMGGDGMAQVGLNACAGTDVPLGVIPAGSGNDFCRGADLALDPFVAVKRILQGRRRRIDLMEATGSLNWGADRRYLGSVVSTGFDARINLRKNRARGGGRALSYAQATLAELREFTPIRYLLDIDGQRREVEAMFVAVANAGFFGGGMHVCPEADINDGLLDLTIVHPVGKPTLVRLLPSMYSGKFVRHPAAEVLRASEVVIHEPIGTAMADGEIIGQTPLTLRAVTNAVCLVG